jgi:uncharacterized protein YjeT (DUF2065 family)
MIKRAYYYLFYKFYKMSEAAPSKWWSEWKASLALDTLIAFFVFSLITYFEILINPNIDIGGSKKTIIAMGIMILIPNYFIFHHRDQWKEIVAEFDQLPKRTNRIGSWIVFGIVLLVIGNLIFSFYLMSQIDWNQYR